MKDCDDDADPRPLCAPLGLPSHPAVPPQKPPGDSPPGTEIMSFTIVPERPQDAALISPLLDRTFGFDRIRQTVSRPREPPDPMPELSFSAVDRKSVVLGKSGSVRV